MGCQNSKSSSKQQSIDQQKNNQLRSESKVQSTSNYNQNINNNNNNNNNQNLNIQSKSTDQNGQTNTTHNNLYNEVQTGKMDQWGNSYSQNIRLDEINCDYTFLLPAISQKRFVQVHKVIDKKSGQIKIVKSILLQDDQSHEQIQNQTKIIKQMKSDHIVKITNDQYFSEKYTYIIIDYCSGGDLITYFNKIEFLTEMKIQKIMKQIFEVLKYFKDQMFININLDPSHILFDDQSDNSKLKILSSFSGNRIYYCAPETFQIEKYKKLTPECNIFSAGVIFHQLLTGQLPFNQNSEDKIKNSIINEKLDMSLLKNNKISQQAQHLLENMLIKDPSQRYNVEQCMQHEWMTSDLISQNQLPQQQSIQKNLKDYIEKMQFFDSIQYFFSKQIQIQSQKLKLQKYAKDLRLDASCEPKIKEQQLFQRYKQMLNAAEYCQEIQRLFKYDFNKYDSQEMNFIHEQFINDISQNAQKQCSDQLRHIFQQVYGYDQTWILVQDLKLAFGQSISENDLYNFILQLNLHQQQQSSSQNSIINQSQTSSYSRQDYKNGLNRQQISDLTKINFELFINSMLRSLIENQEKMLQERENQQKNFNNELKDKQNIQQN